MSKQHTPLTAQHVLCSLPLVRGEQAASRNQPATGETERLDRDTHTSVCKHGRSDLAWGLVIGALLMLAVTTCNTPGLTFAVLLCIITLALYVGVKHA